MDYLNHKTIQTFLTAGEDSEALRKRFLPDLVCKPTDSGEQRESERSLPIPSHNDNGKGRKVKSFTSVPHIALLPSLSLIRLK